MTPAENVLTGAAVLNLADPGAVLDPTVGGKARNLAIMLQGGYPVPAGFIILPSGLDSAERIDLARAAIRRAYHDLTEHERVQVAVRSSANVEDAANASYAGEFDSVLNVASELELFEAIDKVRASASNDRVQAYQAAADIDNTIEMAVVVQQMIPADWSGILFTQDPVRASNQMIGNAAPGQGDRLVSGQINPEIFNIDRTTGHYQGSPAMKTWAERLFELGQSLESRFGSPQDIEWVLSDNKIWILQSRPITTQPATIEIEPEWNDSRLGDYLWVSTNFGEALPDVMTPLTWSMMQRYFDQITLGIESKGMPMGGNIGGRLYGNLSLFASMFRSIGLSEQKLRAMASDAFGHVPDEVEIPYTKLPLLTVLRGLLPNALKRMRLVKNQKTQLPSFIAGNLERTTSLKKNIESCPDRHALAALWDQHLKNEIDLALAYLAAGTSDYKNLSRKLRRELSELLGEGDASALMSGGSSESTPLSSLGPMIGLAEVAEGVRTHADYLRDYGHRGPSEFELSVPTAVEEQSLLEDQLTDIRRNPVQAADLLQARRAIHASASARLSELNPRTAAKKLAELAVLEIASRQREATRSEAVRTIRLGRHFASRTGELTGLGESVYFYTFEELRAALDGDFIADSEITRRNKQYEQLSALPAYPSIIRGAFDPIAWASDPERRQDIFDLSGTMAQDQPDHLSGFAGSPGVVEGRVRILPNLEASERLQPGEILVASTTNVGWTPLFPRAAAIITDIGAPLSHAAIVARELGIPAVVGTGNATTRLNDGDQVRVFGAEGRVVILTALGES
jgi:pyruvate,water dikinase